MKHLLWQFGKILLLFGSTFFFHFLYDILPTPFTTLFAPVNESVWEHMKLISSAWLLIGSLETILLLKLRHPKKNPFFSTLISAISGIFFYLLCYLPFPALHSSMLYILVLLFVTFWISNWVDWFTSQKKIPYSFELGLIGWIFLLFTFSCLSYHPIHHDLFFDSEEEKYGINDFVI